MFPANTFKAKPVQYTWYSTIDIINSYHQDLTSHFRLVAAAWMAANFLHTVRPAKTSFTNRRKNGHQR